MADLNLKNLETRLKGGVSREINNVIGDAKGFLEGVLGTGLGPQASDTYIQNKQKLRFPLDNQDEYDAFIRFTVKAQQPAKISQEAERAARNAATRIEKELNAGKSTTTEFEAEDVEELGAIAADAQPNQSTAIAQAAPVSKQTFDYGTSADLFLPAGLNISDGLDFENIDLGIMGAATENLINSGVQSPLMAAVEGVGSGVASLKDAFEANANSTTAQLAAVRLAGAGPDFAGGAIKSALKTTTNPNSRTLFKSVQIRTFNFTFSMIPSSDREADEINRIIKFFRHEMYPEAIKEAETGVPIGYRFPNIFEIKIRDRKNPGKHLATRIQDCYLTSFQATYNPNGMTLMRDGQFQQTDIAMAFTEIRTLDKQMIAAGY